MGGHDFERVEEHDGGYILVCTCGWRSDAHESAEVVGNDWDVHREVTSHAG